MKVAEVKTKAKKVGVDCGKMKKEEIIRSIQIAEGNQPCFGKSGGQCPYTGCCFMDDCLKIK